MSRHEYTLDQAWQVAMTTAHLVFRHLGRRAVKC